MKIEIVNTLRKISVYPIYRLVGGCHLPKAVVENEISELKKIFKKQDFSHLLGVREIKKSQKILNVIAIANEKTNELLRKYNLPEFFIPLENIHLISKRDYASFCNFLGSDIPHPAFFDSCGQLISVENNNKINWIGYEKWFRRDISTIDWICHFIYHEIIHFKSYNNHHFGFRRNKDGYYIDPKFSNTYDDGRLHRSGLYIGRYFGSALDEALTEELAAKISNEKPITYPIARKALRILIDKLFKRNVGKFSSHEEIFEMFVRAKFTGNILPIARIIKKTFPDKNVLGKLFWYKSTYFPNGKSDAYLRLIQSL